MFSFIEAFGNLFGRQNGTNDPPHHESGRKSVLGQRAELGFDLPPATFLFVSDTHGCSHEVLWDDDGLPDAVFVLGDVYWNELEMIARWGYTYQIPVYGICGNHNRTDDIESAGITDIHGKDIVFNGIRIAALGGSYRYKGEPGDGYMMFDQREAIEIASKLPPADIFLSHDSWYRIGKDPAHQGLKGVTGYLMDNHVPLHFYGHDHDHELTIIPGGTRSECIYGYERVDISGHHVKVTDLGLRRN